MNSKLCHTPPDKDAIQRNKAVEPDGERLRTELTEWLRKNKIVSIFLDTPEHVVTVDIVHLPPKIKPVLQIWGSIYVKDENKLVPATLDVEPTLTLSEAEELVRWVLECCAATRTFKAKDLLQQWQKERKLDS